MKNWTKLFWLSFTTLLLGLTACTPDDGTEAVDSTYSLTAEVAAPGATAVAIKVTTKGIIDFAYLIDEKGDVEYNASQIFNQGRHVEVKQDGATSVPISGLKPETTYHMLFAAATVEETYYDKIVKLDFTTGKLDDEITIYDIDYRSFRVHVNWPDMVQEGNVLKWGVADYYMYNSAGASDAAKLNMNDEGMHNYITESHTFTFDNEIENCCPPDGHGGYDTNYPYYTTIVPGQMTYFFIGEFAYVDEDNLGYWYTDEDGDEIYMDFTDGYHTPGYYRPLFDNEAWAVAGTRSESNWGISPLAVEAVTDQSQFWTGYYACYRFNTKAPEKLDGKITVNKSGLKLNGGTLRFLPDENVAFYLFGVMPRSNWESMKSLLPDSEEETIQWFLTTEAAAYSYGIGMEEGPAEIDMSGSVIWFDTNTEYVVPIICMGNNEGTVQSFQIETFKLPLATKPAPEIIVTSATKPAAEIEKDGPQSPYEIWYNVKCPTKNAYQAMYACNDNRAWESALAIYGSHKELVRYGGYFSSDDLVYINSDEGLYVRFDVLPEMTYGLAASAFSDEGLMGEASYAETTSGVEPLPNPIASDLYETLQGEWTMRTHVYYTVYNNDTLTYSLEQGIRQSKVTIGDIVMPDLPESLYSKFEAVNWEKADVDAAYREVCNEAEVYNAKTRAQNRILCQGFNTYPIPYYLEYNELEYCSPYALFYNITTEKYRYYDAGWIFYDFGPRWFIEVMDDQGTLGVPFNANTMAPLFGLSNYYLVGLTSTAPTDDWKTISFVFDEKGNPTTGYFPVEVSDDKNTITVKALNYNGQEYFPVCASWSGVQFEAKAYSVSELVLTRGWDENTEAIVPIEKGAKSLSKEVVELGGEAPKQVTKPRALTHFELEKPILFKKSEATILTAEQSAARLREFTTR